MKLYIQKDAKIYELKGEGSEDLLQNTSTNDIKNLKEGQSCKTLFLDRFGKIKSIATVQKEKEHFLLAFQKEADKAFKELLEMSIRLMQCELEEKMGYEEAVYIDGREHTQSIRPKKKEESITAGEFIKWRIIYKVPEWQRELDDTIIPLEANLKEYIDSTKGCYTGQEIVARMLSRNAEPAKMLTRFKIRGKAKEKEEFYKKQKEAGYLTTVLKEDAVGFLRREYKKEKTFSTKKGAILEIEA